MRHFRTLLAALGLLAGSQVAIADTLVVESVQQSASVERPVRGMTMDAVRARFGDPVEQRGPVGDPPITRWIYPGFVTYFEYDRVIHSVVPH